MPTCWAGSDDTKGLPQRIACKNAIRDGVQPSLAFCHLWRAGSAALLCILPGHHWRKQADPPGGSKKPS